MGFFDRKKIENLKRHYKNAWDAMAEYTKLYNKKYESLGLQRGQ